MLMFSAAQGGCRVGDYPSREHVKRPRRTLVARVELDSQTVLGLFARVAPLCVACLAYLRAGQGFACLTVIRAVPYVAVVYWRCARAPYVRAAGVACVGSALGR